MALHGSQTVLGGRSAHFRGVAYRVLGAAELQPLPGARLRARYGTDVASDGQWLEVRADQHGFFQIDVPMPPVSEGTPRLEVRVGDSKGERLFKFPLRFEKPWLLDLITDRQLYEPGETVHVWARLRDVRSRRPLVGQPIFLTLTGTTTEKQPVKTAASGVATTSAKIPAQAPEGTCEVVARIGAREVRRSFRIGTRTYERLFAEVKVTPETARPHQAIAVEVKVTTASGAPVRNATVTVKVDENEARSVTDAKALATVAMHAPAYMTHATGKVPVQVTISHPAHGSARAYATLKLAVPLALEVEAVPTNGGLVPELDGVLYIRLSDGSGEPPPAGTQVEVSGAAIRKGSQRAQSDRHGIVKVAARLPRGAATEQDDGSITTVVVHVEGPAPLTAAISVPVLRETEVVPTVNRPVVAPGEPITISLARRTSAARLPIVVELLSSTGLIAAQVVKAGANRVTFTAPADRLGVIHVRARPLREKAVVEGSGGVDGFIVRPPRPSFPTLSADRKLYPVKATARLTLTTTPGAAQSWAAVLVRDLAAHAGEYPFHLEFFAKAFDRAILDPGSAAAETLLRTAIAAYVYADAPPVAAPELLDELGQPRQAIVGLEVANERGIMRDPFPLADELSRRGIGQVMNALEQELSSALEEGRLADVSVKKAGVRGFRAKVLDELYHNDAGEMIPRSLGDGKLTLAMLLAADKSFTYDNAARRVARVRLVRLTVALATYLDPGDDATPQQRTAAREPYNRWLPRMVERGLIKAEDLADPWGGSYVLRATRRPRLAIAVEAANLELVSAGPDGKLGSRDDVRDPFARAVPVGTPYAVASGEDRLMVVLAQLSPGEEVLRRLQEAYQRVTAEVAEEAIGDAVDASVSGGLYGDAIGAGGFGTTGHGAGGGGSGYGTGSGRGSMGGHGVSGPRVGVSGVAGFARVVRERFPPTLFFAPAVSVDPSGKTEIEVKLSEAVTTYVVETIVWSGDGWTWSAKTRIRVDKETVIDAPVPRYAVVGDVLRLPVRVANRTARARTLTVAVFAPNQPDAPVVERKGVVVPGGDAVEVPVELALPRATEGHVTVGVSSAKGVALDAVRRRMVVHQPTRRVRRSLDILASGKGKLDLEVPAEASPREGSALMIRVGAGMFELAPGTELAAWSDAWANQALVGAATMSALRDQRGERLARAVATAWAADSVPDSVLSRALRTLTGRLDARANSTSESRDSLREQVESLLLLAPAIRNVGARPELASDLEAVLRSLRSQVQANIAATADEPHLWAAAAAALVLTAPAKANLDLVRELARRVRRFQLSVGTYTWVATREGHSTTALLALAELGLGERARALALLRTLGQLEVDGQTLGVWPRALARVAAILMSNGKPADSVMLHIDGKQQRVALTGGVARVATPALSRPGHHQILVEAAGAAPAVLYHINAVTEYGLPWSLLPARPGSLVVTIEGVSKGRDERAELELVVRNRSPRAIARPILEISLPAGAELDDEGRTAMRRRCAAAPEATRGTLRLVLVGLPPGGSRRVPLPIRWSVAGQLHGIGVAAYPEDRAEDLSVTPPRLWNIVAPEVKP